MVILGKISHHQITFLISLKVKYLHQIKMKHLISLIHICSSLNWELDTEIYQSGYEYDIILSEPKKLVDQNNPRNFPIPQDEILASNNNMALNYCNGRFFFAWRTSETHFASENSRLHIVSTTSLEFENWEFELTIFENTDLREPYFVCFDDELSFSYFKAGKNTFAFEVDHSYRISRLGINNWTSPEIVSHDSEAFWQQTIENGTLYSTSYSGMHYSSGGAGQVREPS